MTKIVDPAVVERLKGNLQHEMPYGSCQVLCNDVRAMLDAVERPPGPRVIELVPCCGEFVNCDEVVSLERDHQRIGPFTYIHFKQGATMRVHGEPADIAKQIWPERG